MKQLLLISIFFFVGHAIGQSEFDTGVQFLNEKKWKKALPIFQDLSDSSSSVALDYNMGLCYAGLEDFNAAIYFFERALKEEPWNNLVIENVTLAYSKLYPDEYWVHPYSGIERLLLSFPASGWMILSFMLALIVAWMIYAAILKGSKHMGWKLAVVFPVWLVLLYASYFAVSHQSSERFCFPTRADVQTYISKDGLASEEKLMPGKRLTIGAASDEQWICVENGSNQMIWVKREEVYTY